MQYKWTEDMLYKQISGHVQMHYQTAREVTVIIFLQLAVNVCSLFTQLNYKQSNLATPGLMVMIKNSDVQYSTAVHTNSWYIQHYHSDVCLKFRVSQYKRTFGRRKEERSDRVGEALTHIVSTNSLSCIQFESGKL